MPPKGGITITEARFLIKDRADDAARLIFFSHGYDSLEYQAYEQVCMDLEFFGIPYSYSHLKTPGSNWPFDNEPFVL
jgi:hypothetical protein